MTFIYDNDQSFFSITSPQQSCKQQFITPHHSAKRCYLRLILSLQTACCSMANEIPSVARGKRSTI